MTSRKKIRAAVIGCGRIGAFTKRIPGEISPASDFPVNHCAAIRKVPGVELVAVCDINPELAEKAGRLHKVRNIYSDYKKMLVEQRPDIVTVATRTSGRADIIAYAADSGVRGMHIEKPISNNLADTKRALDALKKNGIAVSYGTTRRYSLVYNQAKQMIKSGRFGKLKEIRTEFGKTMLMWAHPHSVDLLNYFVDNSAVDYVQASFEFDKKSVSTDKIDMDPLLDSGVVIFKNGVFGIITELEGKNTRLICEKGEVLILGDGSRLKFRYGNGRINNAKIRKGMSATSIAILELRDAIRSGKKTSMTAGEILKEQNILLALGYSGVFGGKKVYLSEIGDDFTITGRIESNGKNLYA